MKLTGKLDQRCGIYEVTPEDARRLLDNPADKNRPLKIHVALKYARRIKAGLWKLSGEPIILDKKGAMLDGQHRCHAIIEAGKPMETVVLYGDFRFAAMGQAHSRGGDAALALNVEEVGSNYIVMSAVAGHVIRHDRALAREASIYTKTNNQKEPWQDIDNTERVAWVKKNLRALEITKRVQTVSGRENRLFAHAVVAASWYMAERTADPESVAAWFEGLITGSGLPTGDVRLLLRQAAANRKADSTSKTVMGEELLHWIAKAWTTRDDKTRRLFRVKDEESFPFYREKKAAA